jgi:hypothetical protein
MNDRQSLIVAVSCPSAVLVGWLALSLSAYAPALIESSGANAVEASSATALAVNAEPASVPDAATMSDAAVVSHDVATAAPSATSTDAPEPVVSLASADTAQMLPAEATPPTPASAPDPISSDATDTHAAPTVKIASADPTEVLPTETPPLAAANTPDGKGAPSETANELEIVDECFVVDVCVDRYLWALYQRTPKEDSIKVQERRGVTVKRKGKMVTVMRTFTKLVDEDFGWKDPKAANKAGMPLMDYVIGGMDRRFKLKLFHVLHAAEAAGLSPGITSAFRDDYRQSIASGLKAASDKSYHGGSFRGGYGHGLAADIVSVKGDNREQRWTSTEALWKWVDANGKALGIGRPYLDHDPPHVGPIDGPEYISRRGTADRHVASNVKTHAAPKAKTRKVLAARTEHSAAKRQKSARSSKVRTT